MLRDAALEALEAAVGSLDGDFYVTAAPQLLAACRPSGAAPEEVESQ